MSMFLNFLVKKKRDPEIKIPYETGSNNMKKRICSRCKVNLPISDFSKKRNGDYNKQCDLCNEKTRENRKNHVCSHGRNKYACKECDGPAFCSHGRMKTNCKECGGGTRCPCGKIRQYCKEHGTGNAFCKHNKVRSVCKRCNGGSICPHGKRKTICLECKDEGDGGGAMCSHNRIKSACKRCGGGSYCIHNRIRACCAPCGGGSMCSHKRQKHGCKDCNPDVYLVNLCRVAVYRTFYETDNLVKEYKAMKYIGCSRKHLEEHLKSQMTPELEEGFHIDHIKPISKFDLSDKNELLKCCNWRNLQLLTPTENLKKKNKWSKRDERKWCEMMEDLTFDLDSE